MRSLLLVVALGAGCDTVHDRPATWSYVHAAVVAPSCATASCHSRISSVAGIDLSTPESAYAHFTWGRLCGGESELDGLMNITEAEDRIISVLEGRFGLLMPPDQPLAETEIQLVEDWFDAGALCD